MLIGAVSTCCLSFSPVYAAAGPSLTPAPLTSAITTRASPGWSSACVLRQAVVEQGEEAQVEFVTFDTIVEGKEESATLVQVVRGRDGGPEGSPLFGYEHRLTLNETGRPTDAKARAIEGFPIAPRVLQKAAADGRVDIRDAIFSGRRFSQDQALNSSAAETFRLLAPVMPRDTKLREIVEHTDESHIAGGVPLDDGSTGIAVRLDASATAVRRAGATQVSMAGWLLLHRESGLIAGENWTARVVRTSNEPFELVTKITCDVAPVGAR